MRSLSLNQTLGLRVHIQTLYTLLDLMLPEVQPEVHTHTHTHNAQNSAF